MVAYLRRASQQLQQRSFGHYPSLMTPRGLGEPFVLRGKRSNGVGMLRRRTICTFVLVKQVLLYLVVKQVRWC
jgi:hypothetical protein